MKVKIKDKIYNSHDEPIMIILSDFDKKNIKQMTQDNNKYVSYPVDYNPEDVMKWSEINVEEELVSVLMEEIHEFDRNSNI